MENVKTNMAYYIKPIFMNYQINYRCVVGQPQVE